MANPRRKCKLVNAAYAEVDLRQYEKVIIDAINEAVPDKHPKVFQNYFSTDPLSQSEAVRVGRALAKLPELKEYGKEVRTFRLFDGKTYDSERAVTPTKKEEARGGRVR